jgi:hypothetical protein
MAEVLDVDDFFLIFGPAIGSQLTCEADSNAIALTPASIKKLLLEQTIKRRARIVGVAWSRDDSPVSV